MAEDEVDWGMEDEVGGYGGGDYDNDDCLSLDGGEDDHFEGAPPTTRSVKETPEIATKTDQSNMSKADKSQPDDKPTDRRETLARLRESVKTTRKAGERSASPQKADEKESISSKGSSTNEAKSSEVEDVLPSGWERVHSKSRNAYFFHHAESGRTSWDRPTEGLGKAVGVNVQSESKAPNRREAEPAGKPNASNGTRNEATRDERPRLSSRSDSWRPSQNTTPTTWADNRPRGRGEREPRWPRHDPQPDRSSNESQRRDLPPEHRPRSRSPRREGPTTEFWRERGVRNRSPPYKTGAGVPDFRQSDHRPHSPPGRERGPPVGPRGGPNKFNDQPATRPDLSRGANDRDQISPRSLPTGPRASATVDSSTSQQIEPGNRIGSGDTGRLPPAGPRNPPQLSIRGAAMPGRTPNDSPAYGPNAPRAWGPGTARPPPPSLPGQVRPPPPSTPGTIRPPPTSVPGYGPRSRPGSDNLGRGPVPPRQDINVSQPLELTNGSGDDRLDKDDRDKRPAELPEENKTDGTNDRRAAIREKRSQLEAELKRMQEEEAKMEADEQKLVEERRRAEDEQKREEERRRVEVDEQKREEERRQGDVNKRDEARRGDDNSRRGGRLDRRGDPVEEKKRREEEDRRRFLEWKRSEGDRRIDDARGGNRNGPPPDIRREDDRWTPQDDNSQRGIRRDTYRRNEPAPDARESAASFSRPNDAAPTERRLLDRMGSLPSRGPVAPLPVQPQPLHSQSQPVSPPGPMRQPVGPAPEARGFAPTRPPPAWNGGRNAQQPVPTYGPSSRPLPTENGPIDGGDRRPAPAYGPNAPPRPNGGPRRGYNGNDDRTDRKRPFNGPPGYPVDREKRQRSPRGDGGRRWR